MKLIDVLKKLTNFIYDKISFVPSRSRKNPDQNFNTRPINYSLEISSLDEVYSSQDFPVQIYSRKNKFQEGEVFVGFQEEETDLLNQLASITKKKLQVISIVGMAGLGKTTLAARLYNHPYVESYFYTRAWITCSQLYRKRDLLLQILSSVAEITDEIRGMNDNMLDHALYRALKGRRYLIVIDDLWSIDAWNDVSRCFPDDYNGSRIMATTRLKEVALHAQSDGNGNPLCLRFLTEEEGFDLFKRRLFRDGNFFGTLSLIGKRITRKCHGLPLAIVVIAGLLKNNFEIDLWKQIEKNVSSYILSDYNQYMDTLALSYNHLPQHLKSCFLSFGAFPVGYDIPVRQLMWLWIAEGFVSQDGTERNLEDIAKDCLMDLINRSLVVVGKKGSNGAIKTCRIHDLLHDLCLRKTEEENFSPDIYKHNKVSFSCPHSLVHPKFQLLLSTNVLAIPSNCSCYSSEGSQSFCKQILSVWDASENTRALDLSSIEFLVFPSEVLQLVHLRYLGLRFKLGNPPESISCLQELQTLIMSSRMNIVIPNDMWKMVNLNHLCIKSGENLMDISNVEGEQRTLDNLQTMSLVSPTRPCHNILARTPNLQKLGLCGPLTTTRGDFKCPDLGLLMQLEKLKLSNTISFLQGVRLSISTIFPGSLKNLTLSNTCLNWEEAWIFEMIPNLEVLKLKFHAFIGKDWETSPEAFPCLKFLRLDELDLVTWTVCCDHFPVLQHLQVYRCPYLTEIPEDLGTIYTLECLEISGCNDAATDSARDIQEEQEWNGNDSLQIIVKPGLTKPMHRAET